jgi:hypothetical protein
MTRSTRLSACRGTVATPRASPRLRRTRGVTRTLNYGASGGCAWCVAFAAFSTCRAASSTEPDVTVAIMAITTPTGTRDLGTIRRATSSVPSTLVGVTERVTQQRTRRPHETVLWAKTGEPTTGELAMPADRAIVTATEEWKRVNRQSRHAPTVPTTSWLSAVPWRRRSASSSQARRFSDCVHQLQ